MLKGKIIKINSTEPIYSFKKWWMDVEVSISAFEKYKTVVVGKTKSEALEIAQVGKWIEVTF